MIRTLVAGTLTLALAGTATQTPQTIDLAALGPQVGEKAVDFELSDQNGVAHRLSASAGPKGTMLVFLRSADW